MEVTVKKLRKPAIVYKIAPPGNSKVAGHKVTRSVWSLFCLVYVAVLQVEVTSTRRAQTAVWYYSHRSCASPRAPNLPATVSVSGTLRTASRPTLCCGCTSAVTRCTLGRSGCAGVRQVACGLVDVWLWDVDSRYSWCWLQSLGMCLLALPLTTSASFLETVTGVN